MGVLIDSFSKNHSTPYSAIALQEMNLFHFYPSIYWNCACLTIDAKASENELSNDETEEIIEEDEDIDDEIEEEVNEENRNELLDNLAEKVKKRKQSTKYDKIAKAIGKLKEVNVSMELPNINKADLEFSPDAENNAIIFGLNGISGINQEFAQSIIINRPYNSLEDFYNRIPNKNQQMISLIKAGCFDNLEKIHRVSIFKKYFNILAEENVKSKKSLTMTDFNKMAEADKLPENLKSAKQMYFFKEWLFMQPNGTSNDNYLIKFEEEQGYKFYKNRCIGEYNPKTKKTLYLESEEGIYVYKSPFKKMYEDYMEKNVSAWLKEDQTQIYYNNYLKEEYIQKLWNKHCNGTVSQWEMESLCYYYHEHELVNVNVSKYNINNFNELPVQPIIIGYKVDDKTGKEFPKYQIQRIAGTVLGKVKNKYLVFLLTTEGVITIKFYDNLFNYYNKTIKKENGINSKTGKMSYKTVEKPWLTRGNKLLINGIRRDDMFFPRKVYNEDTLSRHTLALIEYIDNEGNLDLKLERERSE